MSKKELEIICIYRSKEGREVEFTFLKDGSDTMEYEDLELPNFLSIMGGISITIDGFKTIYRGMNCYTILKSVSFLLESLYWINHMSSDLLDKDDNFPLSVVIQTMLQEKLVLSKKDDSLLSLNFIASNEEQKEKRGFYYFTDILINIDEWEEAVLVALNEYFYIAEKALMYNPNDQNVEVLCKHINLWTNIRQLT